MELLVLMVLVVCPAMGQHFKSTNNLEVIGNQVSGKTFNLECYTRTRDTTNYASFFRSTNITQPGTRVGYRVFIPGQIPSCQHSTSIQTNYTVSCNSDGSTFTLTIPANNTIEHNTYWRCKTDTDNNVLDNNEVHIVINVTITGISWLIPVVGPNNTVNVTSDKLTTFQCQTTQGRPTANIIWYIDNAPISGGTTTTTPVSGDIVITTGSLKLPVNRTADDKYLSCRATNYVNMEPVESTVKIRVKYAPSEPPGIDGYDNETVYRTRVGRPQSVTCQVPTAYPVPTLSWSYPSYTVTGTTPLPGYTDVVSSSITWTATSTNPGQTCQCTSYQEVSGTVTTYINIDVLYPPSSPTYALDVSGESTAVFGSIYVIQGDTVQLSCNTVSKPPPATDQYRWTRSTGGSWTHGHQGLTITNIDIASDDTYTCEVTNTMATTDGTSDTGRNTSQIEVHILYPPSSPTYKLDVSDVPADVSGRIDAIQGDTVHLTCNTVSNPSPASVQYIWTRSTGGSWTHGQKELTMAHINVSDKAVYTCKVTNTMIPTVGTPRTGTNESVIAVNVLFTDIKTDTPKPSLGPIISGAVGGLVGIGVGVVVGFGVVLLRRRLPAKTPPHRPYTDRNRANLPVETSIPMDTKTYENRTFVHAKGVRIHQLYDYIMENIADDAEGMKNEFSKLKSGLNATHKVADMKQNKEKNRYKNVIAYDDSRVHLEDRDEQQTSYINACHILGYEKVSKFIASQGPTKAMVGDFWQMVWQEDTGKIVMLTNLMELGAVKCIQYWPDAGSVVYGDITVSLKDVDKHPDYTIRSLDIRKGDETPHHVEQFHFQAWPDKNVPDSAWALVSFWMAVTTWHSRHEGPIVVHCSAGVGRTGTYIALDWLYNQAHVEGVVNFFDCVETLRRQRVNMVQTPTQYAYLHETLAETLCFGTLPLLTIHYRQWYAHMLEKIDHPWNKSGHLCSRLEIQHELYLQSMGDYEHGNCQGLGSTEAATYQLKNYLEKAVFLVVNTVRRDADTTLTRIAADRNIKLIINLSDAVLNMDGNSTTVKTFDVTTWGDNGTPETMSEVVALIEDVLNVQPRQTEVSPIMLYSNYPVERCGLICILLNEIQRMKIDGQLSILQSAKSLKSVDERFVVAPNLFQFKFCHDVILEYLNQVEIYQNVHT